MTDPTPTTPPIEELRKALEEHRPDCATNWADGDCDCWQARLDLALAALASKPLPVDRFRCVGCKRTYAEEPAQCLECPCRVFVKMDQTKPLPSTDDVRAKLIENLRDFERVIRSEVETDLEDGHQASAEMRERRADEIRDAIAALSAQSPPPADDVVERVAKALSAVLHDPEGAMPVTEYGRELARAAIAAMQVQSPPPIMEEGLDRDQLAELLYDIRVAACGVRLTQREREKINRLADWAEHQALATAPASALRIKGGGRQMRAISPSANRSAVLRIEPATRARRSAPLPHIAGELP